MTDNALRGLTTEPVIRVARQIVAAHAGRIGTHSPECHLYHVECFAAYVLRSLGEEF